jgi:membrane-bound ClpP family serine protease
MDPLTLAYVLIALGILLFLAELLIPTGLMFGLGLIAVIGGVALTFSLGDSSTGFITLIVVCLALPIGGFIALYFWRKMPLAKQALAPPEGDVTIASMPGNTILEKFRGRIGKAISPLRPSGVVEFDGNRVDCITEGVMVDAGQWVRCIDVKPGKVIVRMIDEPNLEELENTNFG